MRNIWLVARRELGAIFSQPIAYIFAIALLTITGMIFASQVAAIAQAPGAAPVEVSQVLQLYTFLFVFVAPAVTMRLLAEEQRSGTLELLMTLPLRDGEVVVGKWLGGFLFYLATTALTIVYPFVLISFGNPDIGVVLSGYLGVLISGGALIGIGVLASALTENQIVAFFIAFAMTLFLYLTQIPASFFEFGPQISIVFTELSFDMHLRAFFTGLIVAKDVVYFVGLTAVCLFAATRVLESRRWR